MRSRAPSGETVTPKLVPSSRTISMGSASQGGAREAIKRIVATGRKVFIESREIDAADYREGNIIFTFYFLVITSVNTLCKGV